MANKVAPCVMKESIYGQNIDTQSGNSANAYPLLATYGAHSSESSLFYHYTPRCFGCVLFHLSKYWTASLLLRAVHMSSRGIQASAPVPSLLVFNPITASFPPCHLRASPGVCVFDSYPERPAAIDGQFLIRSMSVCLSVSYTQSH